MKLVSFYDQLNTFYDKEDYEGAERFLLKCERETCCEDDWALLVAIYNEQGSFYRMSCRYQKSVEAFHKAKSHLLPRMGENCSEYASLLNNLAGTYRLAKKYDKALIHLTDSLHIYKVIKEEGTMDCANVHQNAALLYQELELYSRAVHHLEKAQSILSRYPGLKLENALIYSNLMTLYHLMEKEKEASLCMNHALRLIDECKDTKSGQIVSVLHSIAGYLYSAGDYLRSAEVYQKAADYNRHFYGENLDYAMSIHSQFWAYRELGMMKDAEDALKRTLRAYQLILGRSHERTLSVMDELTKLRQDMAS